jgi:hypothetical protein
MEQINLRVFVTKETRWWRSWLHDYREIFFALDVVRPSGASHFPLVFKYDSVLGWVGAFDMGQFRRENTRIREFVVAINVKKSLHNWDDLLSDMIGCRSFRGVTLEGAAGVARLMKIENWTQIRNLDQFVENHLIPRSSSLQA